MAGQGAVVTIDLSGIGAAAQVAEKQLLALVETIGPELVADLIQDVAQGGGVITIESQVTQLASDIVHDVMSVIDATTATALVTASFAAVDAEADAAEQAKFPKG